MSLMGLELQPGGGGPEVQAGLVEDSGQVT